MTAALVAAAPAGAAGAAGWSRPFRIAGPSALDLIPAQLAFSPSDTAAVGYGVTDEDNPANSTAFDTTRTARGRIARPRQIRGAQQVLAMGYDGQALELLAGASEKGNPCCSSVQATSISPNGRAGRARTIVSGLAGATEARLLPTQKGLLAAVASERGVWVSQASPGSRLGPATRLSGLRWLPEAMDATTLPQGQSAVVWSARPGAQATGPTMIFIARGTAKRAPRGAADAVTVANGHRIDELAIAAGPSGPSLAWIESWFDTIGVYHSALSVADLRGRLHPKPLSAAGELATGLSFSSDAKGDQALAWKGCAVTGDCSLRAVMRPAHGRFTSVAQLPAIDSSQAPSVAVSSDGQTVLAWIQQGHVLSVQAGSHARAFGAVRTVSATNFAADLSLTFGPGRHALAAWTQGTLNQSLMGALFSTR
jgi:hypothetical protein